VLPDLLALAAELRIRWRVCRFMPGRRRRARKCTSSHRGVPRADAPRARTGHELSLLDIGGGFPADYLQGSPPMLHRGVLRAHPRAP
jgi:hypothetical protein